MDTAVQYRLMASVPGGQGNIRIAGSVGGVGPTELDLTSSDRNYLPEWRAVCALQKRSVRPWGQTTPCRGSSPLFPTQQIASRQRCMRVRPRPAPVLPRSQAWRLISVVRRPARLLSNLGLLVLQPHRSKASRAMEWHRPMQTVCWCSRVLPLPKT